MVIETAIYLNDTNQPVTNTEVFVDGYSVKIHSCGYSGNGVDEVFFKYYFRHHSEIATLRREFRMPTTEYIRIIEQYRQDARI